MSNTDLGSRRVRRLGCAALGFVVTLAVAVGFTAMPGATAAPAPTAPAPAAVSFRAPVVDIAVTPEGLTAPVSHSSGVITFRATTTISPEGRGSAIGLVRLRPGTAPETFATHLGQTFTADPATALAAARALMAEADLISGVQVQPGQPGTFTTRLRPGTYYVFDYIPFEFPPPAGAEALHEFTITEDRHGGFPPIPRSAVWSLDSPTGPVFHAPSRISASDPILFTNLMDQVNEAIFIPLHPEATDADVQAFFEYMEGGPPVPSPFVGRAVGLPGGLVEPSPTQLAVLPGTTHEGMLERVDWLSSMILAFSCRHRPRRCDGVELALDFERARIRTVRTTAIEQERAA